MYMYEWEALLMTSLERLMGLPYLNKVSGYESEAKLHVNRHT